MKIAVLGGTGQTGREIIAQALAKGHSVVALARKPEAITSTHERLTVVHGDGTKTDDVAKALAGVDAVLVAVGPPNLKASTLRTDVATALIAAMKQTGVKKVVWLSAFGVGDSMEWVKKVSFAVRMFVSLFLKKTYVDALAAEEILRAADVDFVLLRPPGLTNGAARGTYDVVEHHKRLPRLRVTRADVATFMIDAAGTSKYDRQFPVVC